MKIVIAGGSGFLGSALAQFYVNRDVEVVVLTRGASSDHGRIQYIHWDGVTIGAWVRSLDGADVLINLTGKSVNCRYNAANKSDILSSRINSVSVLGEALNKMKVPVPLWIQSSSATIYRHSEDKAMNEVDGEIGSGFSVDVCTAWEKRLNEETLPVTRKVILRTGIVLGRAGGALPEFIALCKKGLGGAMGNGRQYISWIHVADFCEIVEWIRNTDGSGVYNCVAPAPVNNSNFMYRLRNEMKIGLHVQTPEWLLMIGARLLSTETELILKSRWVVPARLMNEGYNFRFPNIREALKDLLAAN